MKLNQKGVSLIELMVAGGISAVLIAGGISVFLSLQTQSKNFEFESKKEELRRLIITQVLKKQINCKCLFKNAIPFPPDGIAKLQATPPAQVGAFVFPPAAPDDCDQGSMPSPLVSASGVDGVKLESIELKDIHLATRVYIGSLEVFVSPTVKSSGKNLKAFRIPVGVQVSGSGNKIFEGCSMKVVEDTSASGGNIFTWNSDGTFGGSNRTFPNAFSFCSLSFVHTGGEEGHGTDHCKVIHEGNGIWQVNGSRNGTDRPITCKMTCM